MKFLRNLLESSEEQYLNSRAYKSAIAKLKKELAKIQFKDYEFNKETRELETVNKTIPASSIIERDGRIFLSGEDGLGLVDYYGEYRDGYPYINPDIEKAATKAGGYWEWENPGAIVFVLD